MVGSLAKRGRGSQCLRSFITALLFIIISIRGRRCVSLSPSILSFLCWFLFLWVCVAGLWPPRSVLPPKGFTIASMIAPSTTSWYFYNSVPKMQFKSVGAENHRRLHCTTHGRSILKSSAMLKTSSSCWKIVLDVSHSCLTKAPAQTQYVQIIMDFIRSLRDSSCTRSSIWPPVKASFV